MIKHLGAKDIVMSHLNHHDPEIQKHALLCISKMMVNNWEFVR